jgi:hypothetical protein
MKCPHCRENFHEQTTLVDLGRDIESNWGIVKMLCPACEKMVIVLQHGEPIYPAGTKRLVGFNPLRGRQFVRPRTAMRPPCPNAVPEFLVEDYKEACLVFADSPKAAAALSRRCLQNLLRQTAGVKEGNLADEIQQVIDSGKLPSHLVESIDAIRNIGNFAAHPMKSQKSGEILPVEPGEAEWNLDVLESLFDFYFVQPDLIEKKRAALNKKLTEAGKPAMK